MRLTMNDKGRFFTKFILGSSDQCWLWLGATNNSRYGLFKLNNVAELAHRVAYLIEYGPFDFILCVLHSCDNPPCCNPRHLFLGTRLDNNQDRDEKGRNGWYNQSGVRNPNAQFSDELIEKLLTDHKTMQFTQVALSKKYNMSTAHVNRIIHGRRRSS